MTADYRALLSGPAAKYCNLLLGQIRQLLDSRVIEDKYTAKWELDFLNGVNA